MDPAAGDNFLGDAGTGGPSEYEAALALLRELIEQAESRSLESLSLDLDTLGYLAEILDEERRLREAALEIAVTVMSASSESAKDEALERISRLLAGSRYEELVASRRGASPRAPVRLDR